MEIYCDALVAGSANFQNKPLLALQIVALLLPELHVFAKRSQNLKIRLTHAMLLVIATSESLLFLVIARAWVVLEDPGYAIRSTIISLLHTAAEIFFELYLRKRSR